ncbi:MAG TPA: NF038122 family metalloprotease [Roseiarcus sp.]|nr:NF038122 family metalloprotease [Roseiarcus sp.]
MSEIKTELGKAAAAASDVVSAGGIAFNLLFDAAAMAAPAAFRAGIEQAATLLSQTLSNTITVNIKIDYSGTGGGASAGPDDGLYESYATVRSDLIDNAIPGDTTFNALPNAASIQGQSQVFVCNAECKLFGLLGANDTTTDDGSAHFSTDIPSNELVGVALHELTHALGRLAYGPTPDIFDLFRYTSPGTCLFSDPVPSAAAYFSVDGGVTKLADYGQNSDPGDFLNSGVQGPNDPFNEYYSQTTDQYLTLVDKKELDALGFNVPAIVPTSVTAVSNVSLRVGQSIPASSLIAAISNPSGDAITEDLYVDLGGGSGYFTVNGVRQADGLWFSASPSADVEYVGAPSPGSDTLEAGVYDSTTKSSIYASSAIVATTVARGNTVRTIAPDILFQNASSGQIAIWDMNGLNVVGGGTVAPNPGSSWQAIGTGDFSGGDPDILFENVNSGRLAIWDMNETSIVGGGTVGPDPGPSWQAVGTGDFNGDGHSDILWQNANGQVAIWDMNGTAVTGGGVLGPDPGPQWQAVGTGDFNDDGHSDILWRNSDGQVAIWDMNGTNAIGGGVLGLNPGPGWQAVGTGDFNGDGRSDILFQSASGGQIAIWEMNGTSVIGGGVVSADPGPNWHAVGTDGGGADILFQNTNGQTAIWDMSGTSIVGSEVLGLNPGPGWRAAGLT